MKGIIQACAVMFARLYRTLFPMRTALVIFLIALTAHSYFFHRFRFWNVNSRLALTYAIVDDHSFRIDRYVNHPHTQTMDRAFFNGHYYSDKIIGLSLLGVPVYWAMKHLAGLVGRDPKPDISRYGLTVTIVSLSSALLCVVLLRFLLLLGQSLGTAVAVTLFTAFGTMLFPFSSLFYSYLPSLFFLMSAFYAVVRWQIEGRVANRPPWLPGLLIGLALLCEYTLAIPALLISTFYFCSMKRRLPFLCFLMAAAVPLSIFALYNWICFGNPLSLPYMHLENPEFRCGMSQGLMGVHHFQWYVLYLITIHPYRGVFCYSPFLLLSVFGLNQGLRQKPAAVRWIAAVVLLTSLYYLWLNASYYIWWGGGTLLARHLIPMLPFLALSFAWLPERLRLALMLLGFISIALMVPQSVVEPHFEPFEKNEDLYIPWQTVTRTGQGFVPPFLRHSLPAFLKGRISINLFNLHVQAVDGQLWTLLPLTIVEAAMLFWLWRVVKREHQSTFSKR